MAYTERFKQIEPFVGKMQRAPHAATKVEAGQYSLEAEAQPAPQPDSDVTPVTPEA